jgi:hypothetical protein
VFGALLDKTTGWLDQRLITTILLPALVFWGGLGALLATHVGWAATTKRWDDLDGARQLIVAGGAVVALIFFALLVQVMLPGLIRLYEGYWLLGTPLAGWLIGRQQARWDKLDLTDDKDYTRRYQRFPPDTSDLLPTRLGTTLRAAEAYPGDQRRYGMDAVFFWPRLYPLLPDPIRQSLTAARSSLEQLLLTATLGGVFAVITAVLAAALRMPLSIWIPVLIGTAALAVFCYRAATEVAVSYGELVRAAFDTHRRALLTAMGLELPPSLEAERALWRALAQQLYRRAADNPELLLFRQG